jgi:hypothetical protein
MSDHDRLSLTKTAVAVALTAGIMCGTAVGATTTCPISGITSSSEVINLKNNCNILGNVNLSGSAVLTMTGATLNINGNLVLNGNASFGIMNGILAFLQNNYNEYSITLNGHSNLLLMNSSFVTNATQSNNFSMALQANDYSTIDVENSNLDTVTGSWLLANIGNNSTLNMIDSQNLPTEIYPADSASVSVSGSVFSGVWLDFASGSSGTVDIPTQNSQGIYSFHFGPSTGIGYSVNIGSSQGRLGLNSYPGATTIVNGNGSSAVNDVEVVFGYYVENNTGPVSINDLSVGSSVTRQFTDQGRNLQLNNVNLNPFSWQVYVSQSNGFPVSITNSTINEIAAFTNGLVNVSDSTLQLAVAGAVGPGSIMNIANTQIWSQAVEAENGGQMTITNSELNGNFVSAAGAGSAITMVGVDASRNGAPPQSCAAVDGFPPNVNGVPLCNPFNPLYQCVEVVPPSGGATITATPSLSCPPL